MRAETKFRLKKAALVGLAVGVLGVALAWPGIGVGLDLEEGIGLEWLFSLRGPTAPPAGVVVVNTSSEAAMRLRAVDGAAGRWPCLDDLDRYAKDSWPRCLQAALISTLVRRGAVAITFDVAFEDDADWDADLAAAIASAGNVALQRMYTMLDGEPTAGRLARRLMPVARGVGPWLLPKDPSRRVDRYWTFNPELGNAPTLPVVALQVCALPLLPKFFALLSRARPDRFADLSRIDPQALKADAMFRLMADIRAAIKETPGTAEQILSALQSDAQRVDSAGQRCLLALVKTYGGRAGYLANFYGPFGTIPTIEGDALLLQELQGAVQGPETNYAGSVVFVGVSGVSSVGQRDAHYTVYSRADGVDLTGVEIAATAFANLLTDRPVRQLPNILIFLSLLGFGLAVGSAAYLAPGLRGTSIALVAAAAYFAFAQLRFNGAGIWMFVFIPMVVQLPLALLSGSVLQYLDARREREHIRRAMRFYVPKSVADTAARSGSISQSADTVYGVCLTTDAERFTTVSQRLTPPTLAALLNQYYDLLSEPVQRRGGEISSFVADRMMCVWSGAESDRRLRLNACIAALEIQQAAEAFNRQHGHEALPTRIGINAGWLALANIGGGGHYAYSLVGDVPNGAERIEGLNKVLGTHLLAAAEAVNDLDELLLRRVGSFIPMGMLTPLTIVEIMGFRNAPSDRAEALRIAYEAALGAFENGDWSAALTGFGSLLAEWPQDGPARFFRGLAGQYASSPPSHPAPWTIRVETK